MFFIVSTGRSGTMGIAKTLSQIKGCYAVHEPAPELVIESSAYHYGELAEEKLKKILLDTRRPTVSGSVYCESNQTLSLMIALLRETFPEARFVWLIRNGLDMVASTMQKQWYAGHSENHGRYEDCSPIEKAWIDGRIEGDRCGDMSREQWKTLDRFGRCCWYWGYVNRIIERDLNKCARGRYFTVRLEEIDEKLGELVEWMGLDAAGLSRAVKTNKAKKEPYHWTRWTKEERAVFERFCGESMSRFYPTWRTPEGEWKGVDSSAERPEGGGLLGKMIGGIFSKGRQR